MLTDEQALQQSLNEAGQAAMVPMIKQFDTVAIYLAFSDELCEMKTLPIIVDDNGYTHIKEGAKEMKVAIKWKDMGKFENLLAERIVGPIVKP